MKTVLDDKKSGLLFNIANSVLGILFFIDVCAFWD